MTSDVSLSTDTSLVKLISNFFHMKLLTDRQINNYTSCAMVTFPDEPVAPSIFPSPFIDRLLSLGTSSNSSHRPPPSLNPSTWSLGSHSVLFHQPPLSYNIWQNWHHPYVQHIQTTLIYQTDWLQSKQFTDFCISFLSFNISNQKHCKTTGNKTH